jgi:hypothetical protein
MLRFTLWLMLTSLSILLRVVAFVLFSLAVSLLVVFGP